MPVAARPVGRLPPSFVAGQQLEPGFGDVPTLSTRQQRFTRVRLTSAHLTGLIPPFPATLTTSAIGPTQLAVVWTLILQSEPEGPTLISCAARLPGVARYISHLLAPSWRTIVGVPDKAGSSPQTWSDHVLEPLIQHMVQVDVRKARRDHTPLGRPLGWSVQASFLQDAGFQPFVDHPSNDAVRDSLVEEAPQMAMVDRVEVTLDVDIDAPPHAAAHAGAAQSVERLVGGAAGPEAIRAGEEVLLVNRLQHHRDGPLCHLVFEGRDAERPLRAVRLRDVGPAHRRRMIAARPNAAQEVR